LPRLLLDGLLGTKDGFEMTVFPLVGREREPGALDRLVDRVGERGAALVCKARPGSAKRGWP
jgi:hypothetical protein